MSKSNTGVFENSLSLSRLYSTSSKDVFDKVSSDSPSFFSTLSLGAFDEVEITPTTRGSTALDSTLSNTTKPNQGMKFRSRNYRVVFPVVELRSTLGSRFRRSHSPLCGVRFAYSTESKNNAEYKAGSVCQIQAYVKATENVIGNQGLLKKRN